MVDEYAAADYRTRMDFDAGDDARDVRKEAPQPLEAVQPAPVRPAMHDNRVQARITGHHLPCAACGRVSFDDAGDVFADAAEHDWCPDCAEIDMVIVCPPWRAACNVPRAR